ncbi:MFS transporter [Brevibacillus sp. B_LB10_24]|uniref:MFS transporter n=1 Tax=Brevibacillus sp. B_LB10_24 TaxID=3380645 RepID=UPI0038B82262
MTLAIVNIVSLGFQTMVYMTRLIIPLYAAELGASTAGIGLLTASYALLPLFFSVSAGKIVDRVGNRLPTLLGLLGLCAGLALPFFFSSLWSLCLSQLIVGIAYIFINVPLQNILGQTATPQNRDHYFGVFSMFVALAGVIGPAVGGYIGEHLSYSSVFLAAVIAGLIPFAAACRIPKAANGPKKAVQNETSSLSLLKAPSLRKALLSSALVLYSRDIFVAYFPLIAVNFGLSPSAIGWIIAIQGITMMAVRFLLDKLTGSFGRNQVLFGSILVAGFSFLFVPLTDHVFLLGLISAVMGAGLGCGQPLSMTTAFNASPPSRTGEVLGLRLATNRLSQFLAPMLFGLIGTWAGIVSIFYVSGAFLVGGAFFTKTKSAGVIAVKK